MCGVMTNIVTCHPVSPLPILNTHMCMYKTFSSHDVHTVTNTVIRGRGDVNLNLFLLCYAPPIHTSPASLHLPTYGKHLCCIKENNLKILLHPDLYLTAADRIRRCDFSLLEWRLDKVKTSKQIRKEQKKVILITKNRLSYYCGIYLSMNSWVTRYRELAFPARLPY